MIKNSKTEADSTKTERQSTNDGIEGNAYEQNGSFGVGHMEDGEVKDKAKIAGTIYEGPSQESVIDSVNGSANQAHTIYQANYYIDSLTPQAGV